MSEGFSSPTNAETDEGSIGQLGQNARKKQLKSARWIMIIIGLLTLGLNGFLATQAQAQDIQLMAGAGIFIGVIFIVLGIMVYQFPVPCTIAGLTLYVLANAGFAIVNPMSLTSGIVIKVFIVIGLAKSVGSALAYKREEDAAVQSGDFTAGM